CSSDLGVTVAGIFHRNAGGDYVGTDVIHVDVVAHQRVHAVNSGEFLGQGVRRAVVVRLRRANNTADGMRDAASARVTRIVRVLAGDQLDQAINISCVLVVLAQQ